jgi:hypothetical protein
MDDFNHQLNIICGPEHLGVMLMKPDKRKERYVFIELLRNKHHKTFISDQNLIWIWVFRMKPRLI